MANPIKVDLPKNTWTLVAENVQSGLISIKDWQPNYYYQTYRVAGDPAPTGNQNNPTSVLTHGEDIKIDAVERIDVYMFCYNQDGAVIVAL